MINAFTGRFCEISGEIRTKHQSRVKPLKITTYPSVRWCRLQDSNPLPHDYKSSALPDELSRPLKTQNYTLFDPREPWSSTLARRVGLIIVIGRLGRVGRCGWYG